MSVTGPIPRRALVSEHEFLSLPESTTKTELLDGEVIVTPPPHVRHQDLVRRLVIALSGWASGQRAVFVGPAPLDVRFAPGRILQPDVFVILATVNLDHEGPLDLVPTLCVEVLSSNRVYDRVTKRSVYADAGVLEYWLVEQRGPIERWSGPGLTDVAEVGSELTTPLLPGFTLTVRDLLG